MEVSEGTEILGDEFHLWGWMVDVGTEWSFFGWIDGWTDGWMDGWADEREKE